jgi:hypothetical protein
MYEGKRIKKSEINLLANGKRKLLFNARLYHTWIMKSAAYSPGKYFQLHNLKLCEGKNNLFPKGNGK